MLLEQDRLAPISVASGTIGGAVSVMASGLGDADAPPVMARIIEGRALQPPSPVHLRARRRPGGDIDISWVRRSRVGWSWLSGSDTPMGEEREAYRVILSAGSFRRATEIGGPSYTYSAAQQAADGWSGPLLIEVTQVGTHASSRAAATSVA